ncbi:MAG: RNA polymerase-associated protein RapA, partial [Xanthomonadales bacterium]|nr:RNA polymerase-associated protein RapA [Xanthomonadales bacterium]
MLEFVPGQRWYSLAEPELGLGTVLRTAPRSVQVVYTQSGVIRHYATASAPLERARFQAGDRIVAAGESRSVEQVIEQDGLYFYLCGGEPLPETALDDRQAAGRPEDRLVAARVGSNRHFRLRLNTLQARAQARARPSWGLESARIQLLPHQLGVVAGALAQPTPRVLLADEVGLGKTIEAGLILARLIASGRAERVLILVPEPLVVQWFVELRRRFQLNFAVYDEERVASIEASGSSENPFLDDQWVLTELGFLTASSKRREQLTSAGWDLIIVDEAHHLAWDPEEASPQYQLVEQLALTTPSLILLTATPEQLGRSGHFARLRLLDPDRYSDLQHFVAESEQFQAVSQAASELLGDDPLSPASEKHLATILGDDREAIGHIEQLPDPAAKEALLDALIDRHGTGRVMFRNRRESVGGFPGREPVAVHLPSPGHDPALAARLIEEFDRDLQPPDLSPAFNAAETEDVPPAVTILTHDPRFAWLLQLIEQLDDHKLVLICRSRAKVELLEAALRIKASVRVARFHEGLSLAQRDRNAAYFAQNDGARVLLCSEIGSEGRNFQFAHHLILWDLPADPDLLEQRIGRLDRIGQSETIKIHYCVLADTAQAALARWLEEGLDAFRSSPPDGRELYHQFGPRTVEVARAIARGKSGSHQHLEQLIADSRTRHEQLSEQIRSGRDRLLELATRRDHGGSELIAALDGIDHDPLQDGYVQQLFEHFGIDVEELGLRRVRLDPEYVNNNAFPGLKDGPETITFDRYEALGRDDLGFVRLDHPLVMGAQELLLSSEDGGAAFVIDSSLPSRSVLLEAVFVLETIAPRGVDVGRFLPSTPIRVLVDSRRERRQHEVDPAAESRSDERPADLARLRKVLNTLVPALRDEAATMADQDAAELIADARARASEELSRARERLSALRRVNPNVRESELTQVDEQREALDQALSGARVRLDAVRLIASPDIMQLAARN